MHGKFGLVSPGTASSHSAALHTPPPLHAVFSCFHTTSCGAYSFTTDGHGVCNVHANFGECRILEGESGTTSLPKSGLGGTEKLPLTLPFKGIEPRVFGFEF